MRPFYQDKKVLVTGHTGFKGSWLVKMLLGMDADVLGYSLEAPTDPSLFKLLGLSEELGENHVIGDVRDLEHLKAVFAAFRPEIVFHLAAQPIVRTSYEEPVYTYETNLLGTVNVLESLRVTDSVRSALIVTTDKVYENLEDQRAYREDDRLDGYDPYSNSKSCAELAVHAYKRSFLDPMGIPVSTARAGNVIGGGDFSRDRIMPDCVRAAEAGESIFVRNPYSTRPYQHVLEPLAAYLLIAEKQYGDFSLCGSYNVGPDDADALTTGRLADLFVKYYAEGATWTSGPSEGPHEAHYLRLNHTKVTETFGWHPVWNVEEAVRRTVEWAKAPDKKACTEEEIRDFLSAADYWNAGDVRRVE